MRQMKKNKLVLSLVVFAFVISQFGMAQNQTLRINIELPAGVGLSSMSSFEKSLNLDAFPYGYGGSDFLRLAEDGSFVPLIWIKIQAYENSQFLLDFKNQGEPIRPSLFFFLNDNTNDLQGVQSRREYPALLKFNQNGLLIRSFVPRTNILSAWLGFYGENQPMTLLLEYF